MLVFVIPNFVLFFFKFVGVLSSRLGKLGRLQKSKDRSDSKLKRKKEHRNRGKGYRKDNKKDKERNIRIDGMAG